MPGVGGAGVLGEMEWSRKAACIIDGPSLRAVLSGGGVVNGPERAGLVKMGRGGGRWAGRKGKAVEAAFGACPGSLAGDRWAVGMVPGPGIGCPGWVWPLV